MPNLEQGLEHFSMAQKYRVIEVFYDDKQDKLQNWLNDQYELGYKVHTIHKLDFEDRYFILLERID